MKAAIFDVDGTLTDSVHLRAKAWQMSLEEFGYNFKFFEIRSKIGKAGDQLLPLFLSEDDISQKGEEIEKYRTELFRREFLPKVKPFARVRELFKRMQADGWEIALASSAGEEELSIYKKICCIGDLINPDNSSETSRKLESRADIFLAAVAKLGHMSLKDCVVIGDSPFDAQVAGKAGIPAIGFLCGGFAESDLMKAGYGTIYWGPPDLFEKYESSLLHSGCR